MLRIHLTLDKWNATQSNSAKIPWHRLLCLHSIYRSNLFRILSVVRAHFTVVRYWQPKIRFATVLTSNVIVSSERESEREGEGESKREKNEKHSSLDNESFSWCLRSIFRINRVARYLSLSLSLIMNKLCASDCRCIQPNNKMWMINETVCV